MNKWSEKTVLITGVCGTIGCGVLQSLLSEYKPLKIIGIDSNETELFFLMQAYRDFENLQLLMGDIRDKERLIDVLRGVDILIHCAAYKHVSLCEESPNEAVQTNITGTQNIIEAARICHVERVIFTSSDKAVNPTNVMGTTKLMGERLMTAANARKIAGSPIYFSTRFGNVLGSRGSVLEIFKSQIKLGKPLTLTHREMTRFVMTVNEAVTLVLNTVFLAQGGEVFVTKMPVVKIEDLALSLSSHMKEEGFTSSIKIIGAKPGEKLYEELMTSEEVGRAIDFRNYFIVLPAFREEYLNINYSNYTGVTKVLKPYNSSLEKSLSKIELSDYLKKHKLI